MVPDGYTFSFLQRDYKSKQIFLVFNKYYKNSKTKSFALNEYGKPATGRLSYGIPEGALITYNFEGGYEIGEVLIDA